MSKLFKLKDWFTLGEAAKHLATNFGEEVREADVLRLALDGHLILSVNIVNSEVGWLGKIYPIEEVEYQEAEFPIPGGELRKTKLYGGTVLRTDGVETHVLKFEKNKLFRLSGVYDLPLIGGEAIDVQELYCNLTGQHYEEKTNIDGTFLKAGSDQFLEILESFDDNEYQSGSNAQLQELKEFIAREKIVGDAAEELLLKHKADRKEFLQRDISSRYYPAGRLGSTFFVVRNKSLTDLLQRMAKQDSADVAGNALDKPLATRERDTLLSIIAALCKDAGHDFTKHSKTAGLIQSTAAQMGVSIGETTIEGHLKKIPDALATRMK